MSHSVAAAARFDVWRLRLCHRVLDGWAGETSLSGLGWVWAGRARGLEHCSGVVLGGWSSAGDAGSGGVVDCHDHGLRGILAGPGGDWVGFAALGNSGGDGADRVRGATCSGFFQVGRGADNRFRYGIILVRARLSPFWLALEIEAEPHEAGEHHFSLRFVDEDGNIFFEDHLIGQFKRRPDLSPSYLYMAETIEVRKEIEKRGTYRFDMVWNDQVLGQLRLEIS